MNSKIDGVVVTPLKEFKSPGGKVLRAFKSDENTFVGFGEAYFSFINKGIIRGWKRHKYMTLNIIVPLGSIRFVIYDNRLKSKTFNHFQDINISIEEYSRLTIPPMLWFAFQGISSSTNLLLNIADIIHDPEEVDSESLEKFKYHW